MPCLSRSIDRVFSLNKGDIWRACAFRDSKALGYRPTAAWSRGRPEPGRLWSRSHPVPISKCKADMLPRHQHPCSCQLKPEGLNWTEILTNDWLLIVAPSLQPCASNKNERMVDSAWAWRDCLMRMCFSAICLDMTWLYRRLRVGRLSSSEKKQMSSRSLAT